MPACKLFPLKIFKIIGTRLKFKGEVKSTNQDCRRSSKIPKVNEIRRGGGGGGSGMNETFTNFWIPLKPVPGGLDPSPI